MKVVMNLVRVGLIVALSMALMLTIGCGSDDGNSGDNTDGGIMGGGAIEVMGSWDDNFGGHAKITESMWADGSITVFDNSGNWAVVQNPEDAEWDPSKFSKLIWTDPAEDSSWYYCMVDYAKDTAEAAQNTEKTADDSDPANSGCGGFSWTKMMPVAEASPSDG
ncbi:MAG TPA: hypothetical protein EYN06_01910 [Myxococcales bacterium]|nr:hypothetical protein [Myxococcales bacterium]HIN85206.1 hypothetical protein [Myxococcales bacterium]